MKPEPALGTGLEWVTVLDVPVLDFSTGPKTLTGERVCLIRHFFLCFQCALKCFVFVVLVVFPFFKELHKAFELRRALPDSSSARYSKIIPLVSFSTSVTKKQ